MQLVRGQATCELVIGWGRPPLEFAFGHSLLAKPKTLTVVCQHLDGITSSIAKNKYRSFEWIPLERFSTYPGQAIYAAPKIRGLHGNQDFHLGRDLDH
jgi:hypothetical protein